jgi:hypothetical protein
VGSSRRRSARSGRSSIGANNRRWTTDNEFAKYGVSFAVLSAPQKNATIAA